CPRLSTARRCRRPLRRGNALARRAERWRINSRSNRRLASLLRPGDVADLAAVDSAEARAVPRVRLPAVRVARAAARRRGARRPRRLPRARHRRLGRRQRQTRLTITITTLSSPASWAAAAAA